MHAQPFSFSSSFGCSIRRLNAARSDTALLGRSYDQEQEMVDRTMKRPSLSVLAMAVAILAMACLSTSSARAQSDVPHVEVYGFVQADYIQDFDRVDPAWNDTLRPSKIPTVDGLFGEDGQASISAKQS